MPKFFLYARKSTDEEDRQVRSIEAQLSELQALAQKESLTIVEEFVESRTAKEPGRPIFNAMMARIEKGEAQGILAWHPDRLARNSVDGGNIIYLLDKGALLSLKFHTFWFQNTPQGKFMLNIAFGQSKYYVDSLRETVQRGIRNKLRRGEFPGKPPTGYLNDPRTRTIVVDADKAPLIRRLFETYAEGRHSVVEIGKLGASWGLHTLHGAPITRAQMYKLLSNPFYIGFFRYDGELYEGGHPPLISHELFDNVQNILRDRGKPRHGPVAVFPFRGLLRCFQCSSPITSEKQKGHHYVRHERAKGGSGIEEPCFSSNAA